MAIHYLRGATTMLGIDFSKIKGNPLRIAWDRLHKLPGGKRMFSRMVGETAPYTGTLRAQVEELRDGYACVALPPRRGLTNHLNSTHAIALINLGEMCTGVAVMYSMPGDMRGIPIHLGMDYEKKARGVIRATCNVEQVRSGETYQKEVLAVLKDEEGDVVARFRAVWQISPKG